MKSVITVAISVAATLATLALLKRAAPQLHAMVG